MVVPCSENSCCCVICNVPEQHVLVLHKWGKFARLLRPGGGLECFDCWSHGIAAVQSLLLSSLKVPVTTKTSDHTFMRLLIDIQYRCLPDDDSVYKATYMLDKPEEQMSAYVEDVVRTATNKLSLDQIYREKSAISDKVKENLQALMSSFGYEILSAPITQLDPEDPGVLAAMNRVLELERAHVAQKEANERLTNQIIMKAEAEKVAFIESGKGLAAKRTAIVDGLRESVSDFSKNIGNVTSKDVLELILVSQYIDLLKDVGKKGSNLLFLKHGPKAVTDISNDIRIGFETANMAR